MDIAHLQGWIGATETLHDTATPGPVQALCATLDRADKLPRRATCCQGFGTGCISCR